MMAKGNKLYIQIKGNIIVSFYLLSILIFILASFFVFDFEYNTTEKVLLIVGSISLIIAIFFGFTFRYEYDDEYLEMKVLFFLKIKLSLKELQSIIKISFHVYLVKYDGNKFLFLFVAYGKKTLREFIQYVEERNNIFQSKI